MSHLSRRVKMGRDGVSAPKEAIASHLITYGHSFRSPPVHP
jgi:hypothetical protein